MSSGIYKHSLWFAGARYQKAACLPYIEALHKCCRKFAAKSNVCAGVKLDKPKS